MKHKHIDTLKVIEYRNSGMSINEMARKLKVAPTTIYYHLNKVKRMEEALKTRFELGVKNDGK